MSQNVTTVDLAKKSYWAVLLLGIAAVIYAVFFAWQTINSIDGNYPQQITVEGKGKAIVSPDLAEVTLGVESRAATSDAVATANNAAMNKIIAKLKEQGLKDEEIKTINYSLYPNNVWSDKDQTNKIDGYIAHQDILLKIHDLTKVGAIVSAATSAGANTVSGVTFSVEDQDKALATARAEAIAKAKAKVSEIEKASGLRIGRVMNYYEYSDPYAMDGKGGNMMMSESAVAVSAPSIQPGTQEVTLTVSLTYKVR